MNGVPESDLLQEARAFNSVALAEIYDRYSPALYAYAMRLLGDPTLAEDCVGETFSRFLKSLQIGQGPERHLKAYLYRVAHNWITDSYRRQPPPAIPFDDAQQSDLSTQPVSEVEMRCQQTLVRAALRALTPDQRQVIVLRFLEGLELDEVAAAVEKPVGSVKSLQHRALAALRKMLAVHEEESAYANRS